MLTESQQLIELRRRSACSSLIIDILELRASPIPPYFEAPRPFSLVLGTHVWEFVAVACQRQNESMASKTRPVSSKPNLIISWNTPIWESPGCSSIDRIWGGLVFSIVRLIVQVESGWFEKAIQVRGRYPLLLRKARQPLLPQDRQALVIKVWDIVFNAHGATFVAPQNHGVQGLIRLKHVDEELKGRAG